MALSQWEQAHHLIPLRFPRKSCLFPGHAGTWRALLTEGKRVPALVALYKGFGLFGVCPWCGVGGERRSILSV